MNSQGTCGFTGAFRTVVFSHAHGSDTLVVSRERLLSEIRSCVSHVGGVNCGTHKEAGR